MLRVLRQIATINAKLSFFVVIMKKMFIAIVVLATGLIAVQGGHSMPPRHDSALKGTRQKQVELQRSQEKRHKGDRSKVTRCDNAKVGSPGRK